MIRLFFFFEERQKGSNVLRSGITTWFLMKGRRTSVSSQKGGWTVRLVLYLKVTSDREVSNRRTVLVDGSVYYTSFPSLFNFYLLKSEFYCFTQKTNKVLL